MGWTVRGSNPGVQTGLGDHSASCTKGNSSFLGLKSCQGVTLTPHPLLVLWSRKGRDTPLLPLWAVRLVQSFGACTRVDFTFFILSSNLGDRWVGWSTLRPGCFISGKDPRYPLYRRLGGPRGRPGWAGIRSSDRLARSQSLFQPSPQVILKLNTFELLWIYCLRKANHYRICT